jgi:hypothetical protein
MQYERDHKQKPGVIPRNTLWLRRNPDMSTAARQGDPAMTNLRPSIPPLVPQPAGAGGTFNGEVTATPVGNSTALDTKPDARANPPAPGDATAPAAATPAAATPTAATPAAAASTDPSKQATPQAATDQNAKKKKKKDKKQPVAPTTDQPASAQPASATPAPPAAPSN